MAIAAVCRGTERFDIQIAEFALVPVDPELHVAAVVRGVCWCESMGDELSDRSSYFLRDLPVGSVEARADDQLRQPLRGGSSRSW